MKYLYLVQIQQVVVIGGTAGLAQRGTTSSNYTALPTGTKGKWSEYGVTKIN